MPTLFAKKKKPIILDFTTTLTQHTQAMRSIIELINLVLKQPETTFISDNSHVQLKRYFKKLKDNDSTVCDIAIFTSAVRYEQNSYYDEEDQTTHKENAPILETINNLINYLSSISTLENHIPHLFYAYISLHDFIDLIPLFLNINEKSTCETLMFTSIMNGLLESALYHLKHCELAQKDYFNYANQSIERLTQFILTRPVILTTKYPTTPFTKTELTRHTLNICEALLVQTFSIRGMQPQTLTLFDALLVEPTTTTEKQSYKTNVNLIVTHLIQDLLKCLYPPKTGTAEKTYEELKHEAQQERLRIHIETKQLIRTAYNALFILSYKEPEDTFPLPVEESAIPNHIFQEIIHNIQMCYENAYLNDDKNITPESITPYIINEQVSPITKIIINSLFDVKVNLLVIDLIRRLQDSINPPHQEAESKRIIAMENLFKAKRLLAFAQNHLLKLIYDTPEDRFASPAEDIITKLRTTMDTAIADHLCNEINYKIQTWHQHTQKHNSNDIALASTIAKIILDSFFKIRKVSEFGKDIALHKQFLNKICLIMDNWLSDKEINNRPFYEFIQVHFVELDPLTQRQLPYFNNRKSEDYYEAQINKPPKYFS